MIRLLVDTTRANKFIDDFCELIKKHNLQDKYNITNNNNKININIDFSNMFDVEIASLDIPGKPKKESKESKIIDVESFKSSIDSLKKGSLANNISLASDITGLTKSLLNKIYKSNNENYELSDEQYEQIIKLSNYLNDEDTKNMIMIKRVARTKKTNDPKIIADTIMKSNPIREQTTFADANSIIQFIEKYGIK